MFTGKKRWLISAGSFLLFIVTISFLVGWQFSVIFSLLMLVHEMGHYLVCKWKKFSASPPIFIPFLGAFISIDPSQMNSEDEAVMGYGGPFLGSIAAAALFPLWLLWPGCPDILLLGSFSALWLNFINLVPLRPLDGGRITQVVSPWLRYLGLSVVVLLIFFIHAPVFWLILLMILYAQAENGFVFKCWALCIGVLAMAVSTGFHHLPVPFWVITAYAAIIFVWQWMRLIQIRVAVDFLKKEMINAGHLKDQRLKELWSDIDLNRSFMTREELESAETEAFREAANWEALKCKIDEDKALIDNFLYGVRKQLPGIGKRVAWACCYLGTAAALAVLIFCELRYVVHMM